MRSLRGPFFSVGLQVFSRSQPEVASISGPYVRLLGATTTPWAGVAPTTTATAVASATATLLARPARAALKRATPCDRRTGPPS